MSAWGDPDKWAALRRGEGCPLCDIGPKSVVAELTTSILTISPTPALKGHCCLVFRRHAPELHDLSPDKAAAFMRDMRAVSLAVESTNPDALKINWLSFGNVVPHLHVHFFPRRMGDRFDGRPVDPSVQDSAAYAVGEFDNYIAKLRAALKRSR